MPSIQRPGPAVYVAPATPVSAESPSQPALITTSSTQPSGDTRELSTSSALPQALTRLNLLETISEPGARGSKHFEDLALKADSWTKVTKHFNSIYAGRSSDRDADITKMAQRLNLPADSFKPIMQELYNRKILGPMRTDLGTAELFFRRFGLEQGKQIISRLETHQDNPNSRLPVSDRQKISASLFRDLAVPGMIGQGGKGSCAAASIHVMLASSQPQEFLDMTLKLAEGQPHRLPDGQTLKPNDDWQQNEDRQLSEAITQNALMDLMLGAGEYHSHLDKGANQTAPSAGQQTTGLEKLSGNKLDYDDSITAMIWPASSLSASRSMGHLEDELSRGRPVLVNVWGHAMAVVGMDKTGPEPKVLVSTYGAQIELPASELEDFITHSITVDDEGRDNQRIAQGQRLVIGTDLGRLP